MTVEERISLAASAWEACQRFLPESLRGAVAKMAGDPAKFDKHTRDSARLRIRPKRKEPANFWGGWTWYELHVGRVPSDAGLNVGHVIFLHASNQSASGSGAYASATWAILQKAEVALGQRFRSARCERELSLGRLYKGAEFSAEEAGKDLARLIAETLPELKRMPEAG